LSCFTAIPGNHFKNVRGTGSNALGASDAGVIDFDCMRHVMKGSRSKLLQSVLSPIAATVSIANIKASKPKLSVLQGLSRLIGLVAKLCRRFLHKVTFELGRSMLATAFHPVLPRRSMIPWVDTTWRSSPSSLGATPRARATSWGRWRIGMLRSRPVTFATSG
jgi:hypothetical protein